MHGTTMMLLFAVGQLTGATISLVPLDLQPHDSHFIVAHFRYVLIGGAVFPLFGAFYYWFPKIIGGMLSERVRRWNFWPLFAGFNLTFFPLDILGLRGMPRRVYTYRAGLGWHSLNLLATVGGVVLAAGVLLNWVPRLV